MTDFKNDTILSKEKGMELGVDLTLEQSGIKVADVIDLHATQEDDRRVLFKIDR